MSHMSDDVSATPSSAAEIRETHGAVVVLIAERAYKVKKPVNLGFLDFTTLGARHHACLREFELNRRFAPDVYLDVAAVAGSDGRIGDYLVVMRRMPDASRLSTLVREGADVDDQLRTLAQMIATFHAAADRSTAIAVEGTAPSLRRRWGNNLDESKIYRGTLLGSELYDAIAGLAMRYIDGREPLLAERSTAGLVVDGHGDLVSEDIFCLPDYPRVLDCIEFDDRLRAIDVLDDVAFLAMDLEHLGRPDLATRFLRWYMEFSGTPTVSSLEHHYIAYRAFVRAKVSCVKATQGMPGAADDADVLARLALRHLRVGEVTLTLVGGAPGTGKSTLAAALADKYGAVLLSSDVVRKESRTVDAADRYSAAAKEATYRELLDRARLALEHGESVVADATWTTSQQRNLARHVATETSSRLVALECRTPRDQAAVRAARRLASGGATSDAGADVARRLDACREPWPEAVGIDTSATVEQALDAASVAVERGRAGSGT